MKVSEISKEHLQEEMEIRRKYTSMTPCEFEIWRCGWMGAINFLTYMEDKLGFCTHCNKPVAFGEENYDAEGNMFCNECYDKLVMGTKK